MEHNQLDKPRREHGNYPGVIVASVHLKDVALLISNILLSPRMPDAPYKGDLASPHNTRLEIIRQYGNDTALAKEDVHKLARC